ncbi:MAG: NAD(P)H-dependent oxidoreductase, partial [Pseudomonadota bacterium]
FDQIARAGVTFRYTADGPIGLVESKPVYIAAASGGVPLGAPADYATPHIKTFFSFLGLTDIRLIDAAKPETVAA